MTQRPIKNISDDDQFIAAQCIGFNLRKAARAVGQVYDAMLEPCGLKGTQFSLLVAASIAKGASISQLADALVMDRTTLTRNLRPLTGRGLLTLKAGADRRQKHVLLTEEGQSLLEKARPLWRKAHGAVLEGLDDQARDQIIGNLSRATKAALNVRTD